MNWKTRVIKEWLEKENISVSKLTIEQVKEILTSKLLTGEDSYVGELKDLIIMNWLINANIEYDKVIEEIEEDIS